VSLVDARARIEERAHAFSGTWTWAAHDLCTGERAFAGDQGWFPTASAAKLPIHSAIARAVSRGEATWQEPHTLSREGLVGDDGILAQLVLPLTLPLADFATLMLIVSENSATNVVIDRLGVGPINDAFAAFGLLARSKPVAESEPVPD
jgi:beta-lactamase class A